MDCIFTSSIVSKLFRRKMKSSLVPWWNSSPHSNSAKGEQRQKVTVGSLRSELSFPLSWTEECWQEWGGVEQNSHVIKQPPPPLNGSVSKCNSRMLWVEPNGWWRTLWNELSIRKIYSNSLEWLQIHILKMHNLCIILWVVSRVQRISLV